MIEWAKSQGRLVTKAELANKIGTKRLSPSYFEKYPELGKYVVTRQQNDLQEYYEKLYDWLQKNEIPYKPNDKTKTKTSSVDVLLLNEYSGIALQIAVKPRNVSYKDHTDKMNTKRNNAISAGLSLLFLYHEDFVCLDNLKQMLEALKRK